MSDDFALETSQVPWCSQYLDLIRPGREARAVSIFEDSDGATG